MLFNVNLSTNEAGNLIIEVPTGIRPDMTKEEVYERLKAILDTPYAYTKDYTLRDGSINRYTHFATIEDRRRYHDVAINGVTFKLKLDVVLTSKEVEQHKPVNEEVDRYRQLLEQGLISQEAYEAILKTLHQ